jgi:hypothetical protein
MICGVMMLANNSSQIPRGQNWVIFQPEISEDRGRSQEYVVEIGKC